MAKINRTNKGKELKKAMKRKGLRKYAVAQMLGVSRPTLDMRLMDGCFTESELAIVNGLINGNDKNGEQCGAE